MSPKTLYDKIWDAHVADEAADGTCLLYIDRHLVHEVTSRQGIRDPLLPRIRCAPRHCAYRGP